jgi:hypothetical protein
LVTAATVLVGTVAVAGTVAMGVGVAKELHARARHPISGPAPDIPEMASDDTDSVDDLDDDVVDEAMDTEQQAELVKLRKIAKKFILWLDFQMDFTPWIQYTVEKVIDIMTRVQASALHGAHANTTMDMIQARDLRYGGVSLLAYSTSERTQTLWAELIDGNRRDFETADHFSRSIKASVAALRQQSPDAQQVLALLAIFDATIPQLKINQVELLFPSADA